MRKLVFLSLAILALGAYSAKADSSRDRDDDDRHRRDRHYRLDCRFYDHDLNSNSCEPHECGRNCDHECHKKKPKHCVASATYKVWSGRNDHDYKIKDIRYGVRCDGETIFANEGKHFATNNPTNNTVEDHIRPLTSNVPETTILNSGALANPGTYEAILYLAERKLKDGSCDITEQDDDDDHHLPFLN